MATVSTTTTKFVTEPKQIFSLSTNDLSHLLSYSPNASQPEAVLSKVSLPAGSFFCPITTATLVSNKSWSTVQVSETQHIELNSALVFLNHSCVPTMEIDTTKMEVRVSKNRNLEVGDELSFFYPSTEWYMAKPFVCLCGCGQTGSGEGKCLGTISGASSASIDIFKLQEEGGMFFNEHILKMKRAQQASRSH